MKRRVIAGINRLLSWLIALLLMGVAAAVPAYAEENTTTTNILPLVPDDLVYESGNVILHKHGERIGPTEWKVVVRATIGDKPIEKRRLEVVFLLDTSTSMVNNNAHTHDDSCYALICTETEHTHETDCYSWSCTKEEHVHSEVGGECYEQTCDGHHQHSAVGGSCYAQCTRDNPAADGHWQRNNGNNNYRHIGNTNCISTGNGNNRKYYYLVCNEQTEHTDACYALACEKEVHTHTEGSCYTVKCDIAEHTHESSCYDRSEYACGITDRSRLAIATAAAERLIANLPDEVTDVTRLVFNDIDNFGEVGSYTNVTTSRGTHMWSAINSTLNGNYFSSSNATKKVFVILTDGEATDSSSNRATALSNLKTFKSPKSDEQPDGKDGTVFTIGFGTEGLEDTNAYLEKAAEGNGGKFMLAENATQLFDAFEEIERELTAMLIDPMGTTVGFDKNSILGASTTSGVISWSDDTIYWNPSESTDGSGTVSNSVIEYSYTVELNNSADKTVGEHYNVELNNPTDFLYGIKDPENNTIIDMKQAAFPIPRATYKLSSIETSWVDEDGKAIPVTGYDATITSKPIICDYSDAKYHPEFDPKYTTVTEKILLEDGSYYLYTGSTVEAVQYTSWHDSNEEPDGEDVTKKETVADVTGLGAIDPSKPYHYTVVHNYRLVEANKLILTATKEMVGRNFLEDEEYKFVLSAAEGTPMPDGAVTKDGVTEATVTIKPTTGGTYTFVFPDIVYNEEGEYTYTVSEVQGTLDDVIYDPTEHTVKVVVTKNAAGNGFIATCTLDGPLVFTNRLVPGNLKVEKTGVSHYNSNDNALETLAFPFGIQVNDKSGRPMTGTYTAMKTNTKGEVATTVTFDAGYATVTLKAGESIEIVGLPMDATYTVAEYAPPGFIATATGATGTIVANKTVTASFENAYHAEGKYQFRATKVLKDADGNILNLAQGQFAFRVLDEAGNVVSTVTNNADGSIFFHTLTFTEADMAGINEDGEVTKKKKYTIVEVAGSDASILYDGTEYNVTLTIVDKGDGTLTITDDLGTDGKITFTNTKISNQLVVSKTVAGNLGSRNREFTFTVNMPDMANKEVNVSYDGGATFTSTTLDGNGQVTFTLKHGERIIFYPVTGSYTVTETDYGSYDVAYSVNQGDQTEKDTASGTVEENGTHVAFVNTLEATVPTGIHTPVASALIGICLAGALIAIALIGRRGVCYES